MTHGEGGGLVMRKNDGSAMSKAEVIIMRRGAFRYLPVLCSNDLVHGSWWMVWGSLGCMVCAIVPLCQGGTVYQEDDDFLPSSDFVLTWVMLIFSGFFFALGSLAFVRAFGEPPKKPLFHWYKHFQTDELLGAWMFLLGTIPAVPYTLVFFLLFPSFQYISALASATIFVIGTLLFVVACYPSKKKVENYLLPLMLRWFGAQMWVVKHLANDWLAGTWFFFWANALFTFGAVVILMAVLIYQSSSEQLFIWLSTTINSLLFLIGSAYFVAGSYPHSGSFYYATDKGFPSYEASHLTTERMFAEAQEHERHIQQIQQQQLQLEIQQQRNQMNNNGDEDGGDEEAGSPYDTDQSSNNTSSSGQVKLHSPDTVNPLHHPSLKVASSDRSVITIESSSPTSNTLAATDNTASPNQGRKRPSRRKSAERQTPAAATQPLAAALIFGEQEDENCEDDELEIDEGDQDAEAAELSRHQQQIQQQQQQQQQHRKSIQGKTYSKI